MGLVQTRAYNPYAFASELLGALLVAPLYLPELRDSPADHGRGLDGSAGAVRAVLTDLWTSVATVNLLLRVEFTPAVSKFIAECEKAYLAQGPGTFPAAYLAMCSAAANAVLGFLGRGSRSTSDIGGGLLRLFNPEHSGVQVCSGTVFHLQS